MTNPTSFNYSAPPLPAAPGKYDAVNEREFRRQLERQLARLATFSGNVTSVLGAHADAHESGGADEIDLGALAGALINAQVPAGVVTQHQAALAIAHTQVTFAGLIATQVWRVPTGSSEAVFSLLPFADIASKPTTLAGYGITDAYTQAAVDALLAGKSDVGHTHDDRYYTESEVDTALALKANLSGATFTGTVTAPFLKSEHASNPFLHLHKTGATAREGFVEINGDDLRLYYEGQSRLVIGSTGLVSILNTLSLTGGNRFLHFKNVSDVLRGYVQHDDTDLHLVSQFGAVKIWTGPSGTEAKRVEVTSGGDLVVGSDPGGSEILRVGGGIRQNEAAALLHAATALTDGAGAASGTLLNAPAAGNPTKWIPIDDAGTTRHVPAW